MCESTVWVRCADGRSEKVAEDILVARQEGDWVVLRGLLKEPQRIRAMIHEVDSLKHTITLVARDSLRQIPHRHIRGGKAQKSARQGKGREPPHEHRH